MSDDAPQPSKPTTSDAPAAVIRTPAGTHWVHEAPEEIEEKLADAKLGVAENDDGTLHLVGLDLFPGDPIKVVPFALAIQPMFIIEYRGVSEQLWQAHLEAATQMRGPAAPPLAPPLESQEDLLETANKPMPMLAADADRGAKCCCEHTAGEHGLGEGAEFIGPCMTDGCDCPLFHQHVER